ISRLRAEQTGLWHRKADGSDLERNAPTRDAGYDHDAIQSYVQLAIEQNEQWARWFAEQSIMPLKITYEELSRQPQAVLSQILTSLGIDASLAETVPIQTAKLADETNTFWRSRFEAESKGAL
ncbi:MAG: Stf0 family sulfotransferase, partial [Marinosulfonomonas sp.]